MAFGWPGALRPLGESLRPTEILALPTRLPAPPPAAGRPEAWTDLAGLIAGSPGELARDLLELFVGSDRLVASAAAAAEWVRLARPGGAALARSQRSDRTPAGRGDSRRSGRNARPQSWIIQPLGGGPGPGATLADPSGGSLRPATGLAPGSACAVPLVTGDAELGAIGTVTWVEGDQVYMMGHPFLQRGPVNLPLATAEILTVFPSRQMSFKMGYVGRDRGHRPP